MLYKVQYLRALSFWDPDIIQVHTNYPFLVSILEAEFYNFMGHIDDRIVKFLFALAYTLVFISLFYSVKSFSSSGYALLISFTYIMSPFFFDINRGGSVLTGHVDIFVSLFLFLSVMFMYKYMDDKYDENLILSSLFAVFLLFTKKEGFAFFVIVLLSGFLVNKNNKKGLLLYLFLTMYISIFWFAFRFTLPSFGDEKYHKYVFNISVIVNNIDRLPIILKEMLLKLMNVRDWGLWNLLFFTGMFYLKDKERFFGYIVIFSYIVYIWVCMVSSWVPEELIFLTANRFMVQILPIMVFAIARIFYRRLSNNEILDYFKK